MTYVCVCVCVLQRYALSNALAVSVKLDVWEQLVDDYIDSMSYILSELKVCACVCVCVGVCVCVRMYVCGAFRVCEDYANLCAHWLARALEFTRLL